MGVISNGTTLFDAGALDSSIAAGAMTLIKTLTASSSSNLSFVHGSSNVTFDGTYKEYVFKFMDIHPSAESKFGFNVSVDGGSNYNVSKTTTSWRSFHNEAGNDNGFGYADNDLHSGTGDQPLSASNSTGQDNDQCCTGTLHFYNPADTTFIKNFMADISFSHLSDYSVHDFIAGYANTTTAVNAIRFQFASGNIDAGTIKMYGIN